MTVIDASVAVKFLLPEPQSDEAIAILEAAPYLLAPALIRVEVGNALVRAYRSGRIDQTTARSLHRQWDALVEEQIELIPTVEIYPQAVDLAYRLKHPLPDCLYLALAVERDRTLLTADRALLERGRAAHRDVRLLAGAV